MSMLDTYELDRLHAYYAASDERDLDAAWADAQCRAIRVLQQRIDRINRLTRADYEKHNGIKREEA